MKRGLNRDSRHVTKESLEKGIVRERGYESGPSNEDQARKKET